MRPSGLFLSAVLMLSCYRFSLLPVRGLVVCNEKKFNSRINLTTDLKTDVLLPCVFDLSVFRSILTNESSVVWSYINTADETVQNIVEIKVDGVAMLWDYRRGRIKTFRRGHVSGNFSILIADVQSSDLGLYHCELFRKTNCSLGHKEISLSFAELSGFRWLMVSGAGGGFLLLCLISVCVYCTRTKRQIVCESVDNRCHDSTERKNEVTYASVAFKSRSCNNTEVSSAQTSDEVTYASVAHTSRSPDTEVLACKNGSESEPVSSETVLYAAVKQDRR